MVFRKKLAKLNYTPFMFLFPTLTIMLIFSVIPVIWGFCLSFTDYPLLQPPKFIGLGNYTRLLGDEVFKVSLINTFRYILGTVPSRIVIGFCVAVLLNEAVRGRNWLRAMYFFPVVAPLVSVSMLWQWMFHANFGIINALLRMIGFAPVPWLTSTKYALSAVMIMSVWKTIGWNMVVFLSGLQGISESLYEAATVDGANSWQKMRYVTIPLMKPIVLLALVISTIDSSKVFEQVYIMTGGGPGYSTMTLVQQIYNAAFKSYEMGYASAIAVVLFILVSVGVFIQFRCLGDKQ